MLKLVHAVWNDSTGTGGWSSESDFYKFAYEPLHRIDTFGLLVLVTEEFIVMASSFGHAIGDSIKIPMFALESVEVIREEPISLEGFPEVENIPKLKEKEDESSSHPD